MHEVSIAQNILDIVEKEANKRNAGNVYLVKIVLGQFTGIVKEALLFALDTIKKNTLAESAKFDIDSVKLITSCSSCNTYFDNNDDFIFACPYCEGNLEIVKGKELYIDYIDLE